MLRVGVKLSGLIGCCALALNLLYVRGSKNVVVRCAHASETAFPRLVLVRIVRHVREARREAYSYSLHLPKDKHKYVCICHLRGRASNRGAPRTPSWWSAPL
jgi:hypothetical protein